jgi:hypothetical protein
MDVEMVEESKAENVVSEFKMPEAKHQTPKKE